MTARRIPRGRSGRRSGKKPESILRLTATRTATTTIRVTKDGVVVITDAVLCELIKRLEAEKKKVIFKVECPTRGKGGKGGKEGRAGEEDDEGPPSGNDPPESNCEGPPSGNDPPESNC